MYRLAAFGRSLTLTCAICLVPPVSFAQELIFLVVTVESDGTPVQGAQVTAGAATGVTDESGTATLRVPAGRVDVVVTHEDFDPGAAPVDVAAGAETRLEVELEPQSELEETIVVTATRSERRVEDEPLRVEVVPEEEVQEKIAMAPGDVSMLLAETNGLRVQTTSPSVGGATVRIQGLSGRYTQILADGLPLYGQSGSVGILQIPPMDLGQVEVIKGVASSLYGMSAIGGVVNLVSRKPTLDRPEREFLINQTSHRGTDAALWISQALNERWGFSVIGGTHWQKRSDLDGDGWTDLPMFRRVQARPRLMWNNGAGRSVLVTAGTMTEGRRGGTMPGRTAPDGNSFAEHLDTTRIDTGVVGRFLLARQQVLAVRASASTSRHDRAIGSTLERDRSVAGLGEVSLTGTTGRHTWVGGGAVQYDRFTAHDVPRFNFRYVTPGIFGQDDVAITPRVTVSAGARIDRHSEFGAFASPRVSLLWRPAPLLTARLSTGRGHFAPQPFTEDTEATGLTPLAPLQGLEPEHATSASADLTWRLPGVELTTTLFRTSVENALLFEEDQGAFPARLTNAAEPTRTHGSEIIARYHADDLDIILTHMYLWSTEFDAREGRREVPLNPRHSAGFDVLWEMGATQIGFETFYTGRLQLDDNPYRTTGSPYLLWGVLLTHRVGAALLYLNTENMGDVRQTKSNPLLFPRRLRDGRWSTDAWAPLEGRTVNAGVRLRF